MILTASRDRTVIVWQLTRDDAQYGYPKRILKGHNHFVSDVAISYDGQFALSSSWDKTLRLWDLNTGVTTRRFVGHEADVLSVSFSADNRQIVSGSRDRTIKLWNTLGECKFDIKDEGHSEWVSCVRFSPNPLNPVIVSAGWDKVVKVSLLLGHFLYGMMYYIIFATSESSLNETLFPPRSLTTIRNALFLPNYSFTDNFTSRFGSFQTVSSRPTTTVTPVTSTPFPSPQMVPSLPQVVRMVSPCSGTSTKASTSTPSKLVTLSTLSSSHQTVTGYALLPHHASRSSTSSQSLLLMNSSQTSLTLARTPANQKLSHSPGQLTVKPSLQVTLTTLSVSGPSLKCSSIRVLGFVTLLRGTHDFTSTLIFLDCYEML